MQFEGQQNNNNMRKTLSRNIHYATSGRANRGMGLSGRDCNSRVRISQSFHFMCYHLHEISLCVWDTKVDVGPTHTRYIGSENLFSLPQRDIHENVCVVNDGCDFWSKHIVLYWWDESILDSTIIINWDRDWDVVTILQMLSNTTCAATTTTTHANCIHFHVVLWSKNTNCFLIVPF